MRGKARRIILISAFSGIALLIMAVGAYVYLLDGKPLRYSREKGIIWSVGQDRVDSGGGPADKPFERNFDEPTLKIDP